MNLIDQKSKKYIKIFKEEATYQSGKVDDLTMETDGHKQLGNRLLIHEIPENKNEDTDTLALKVLNTKMEIKVIQNHIDRTHKINKQKTNSNPRPVIT